MEILSNCVKMQTVVYVSEYTVNSNNCIDGSDSSRLIRGGSGCAVKQEPQENAAFEGTFVWVLICIVIECMFTLKPCPFMQTGKSFKQLDNTMSYVNN